MNLSLMLFPLLIGPHARICWLSQEETMLGVTMVPFLRNFSSSLPCFVPLGYSTHIRESARIIPHPRIAYPPHETQRPHSYQPQRDYLAALITLS